MFLAEQNVRGLYIAVDDTTLVRVVECLGHIGRDAPHVCDRKPPISRDSLAKRFPFHERHRVVQEFLAGASDALVVDHTARVIQRKDVRMLKLRDHADLAAKALAIQCGGDTGGEQLERDRSAMFDVVCEIYGRHSAAPDFTNDRVWPDGLSFETKCTVRAGL